MADADLVECADAVTAALNGAPPGTFSLPFAAVRLNNPTEKLEGMEDLHVTVVPSPNGGRVAEFISRNRQQVTLKVELAIQQQFENADDKNGDSDPLIKLALEIANFLISAPLTGGDGSRFAPFKAVCGDEDSPFLSQEKANENLFTAVVSAYFLTFQKVR